MNETPFWAPQTFIPTIGMLLGNLLSGIAVALNNCLTNVDDNKERLDTYLAFGASRWEAGRSIAVDAIRVAMLPTINQMSVIGLIAIPGNA
jgi:ABC-type iron transport system FetAB permease component